MGELLVRPAGPDDREAVLGVLLASRASAVSRGVMPPGIHPDHEVRDWVGGWLAQTVAGDGAQEVWLAQDGEAAVGYARLTPGWLDDLYVHPDHAGHGVGSTLLDLARSGHPEGFCLWVFEANTPARAFYRKHGLVELERTDGRDNEERAPDIRLAWPGTDPLAFFRGLIDGVDDQLGDLLARRAALTRAVQPHKAAAGRPGRDAARERAIAEALAERAPALGAERLSRIVDVIVTESLAAAAEDSAQEH